MPSLPLHVENLDKDNAQRFEDVAASIDGVKNVETWEKKAVIGLTDLAIVPILISTLQGAGFAITTTYSEYGEKNSSGVQKMSTKRVSISGMTCRSCELIIERKFKKLPGVKKVNADAAKGVVTMVCEGCEPDVRVMQQALQGHEYSVLGHTDVVGEGGLERPSFLRIVGLFAVVFLLGGLLKKLGLFSQGYTIGGSTNFFTAIVIGLVAGSSSCIAVSGGLLLSSAAKYNERYGQLNFVGRMQPVFFFIIGRTLSYALFGGLIGILGSVFTPSTFVTGGLTVLAALFMLVMGLDMLKIAPVWFKGLMPRMPKSLSHRVLDAEGKNHPVMPMLLGAGTFFLPCGFTQALQLYALTVGSFFSGAAVLGGFALGTAPALLALGWASSSLKGKAGKLFFQFAGALVIVLGLWNIQNGLTIAGYPLSLPKFEFKSQSSIADAGSLPPVVDNKQVIKMTVGGSGGPYDPDVLTVKAGVPVRWEINGEDVYGCISSLISRSLGIRTLLKPGLNVVEFTADKPGTYSFSCSMGMFRGTINAVL